jgi:hypothetical protein
MEQKELIQAFKIILFHRNIGFVFRLFIVAHFGGHTKGNSSLYFYSLFISFAVICARRIFKLDVM